MAAIDTTPLPMSFPAILRNPGINTRFAHLQQFGTGPERTVKQPKDKDGKRRIRRRDNARFTNNPHIVPPTSRDLHVKRAIPMRTFPEPLPAGLSRNILVPSPPTPVSDPASAQAGQYTLSLKGVRQTLRRSGFRAEGLVRSVEREVMNWLEEGNVVRYGELASIEMEAGRPIGDSGSIKEVERTPFQLVWMIQDDAFARYVVHCVARWHSIVSYSKNPQQTSTRLTYLLRPNVTRPNIHHGFSALDTPPATDFDSASSVAFDSQDSDFSSDRGNVPSEHDILSDIEDVDDEEEEELRIRGPDGFVIIRHEEGVILPRMQDLSLHDDIPRPSSRVINRTSSHLQVTRSTGSSPSRSPSGTRWRRTTGRAVAAIPLTRTRQVLMTKRSFCSYLYD